MTGPDNASPGGSPRERSLSPPRRSVSPRDTTHVEHADPPGDVHAPATPPATAAAGDAAPAPLSTPGSLRGAPRSLSEASNVSHASNARRASTLMLDDDDDEPMPDSAQTQRQEEDDDNDVGALSRASSGEQVELGRQALSQPVDSLVETVIEWKHGGAQVYVTGTFTGWRQMIPLHKFDDQNFGVVLKLAPGMHRLRFVVDGELRCSDTMHTATDSMGNLVNYMEVVDVGQSAYTKFDETDVAPLPPKVYTKEIPDIFVDPEALDRLSSSDFTTPPQLPPHLDGVILNANWNEKDNNSVLPVPTHVVLNHLATTSIRHNVLAVASVSRYRAKFVTQILYTPL